MSRWSPNVRARTERWQREDGSPRLKDEVPALLKLKLDLSENGETGPIPNSQRVRHIIVDRAAAHFEFPCSDTHCEGGGHDVTPAIMTELQHAKAAFSGEHACMGRVGEHACERVLVFNGHAEYSKPSEG